MSVKAAFVFPPDDRPYPIANVQDGLLVTYVTPYDKANLTLYCPKAATSSGDWYMWKAANNPILGNGTYNIHALTDVKFKIAQYPVLCHFRICDHKDYDNGHNGGAFTLASDTQAAVKTLSATSTSKSASTTSTKSTASGTAISAEITATTTATIASSSSPVTGGGAIPTGGVPLSATGPSTLSTAAKAGIGVGVTLGVILFVLAVAFMIRFHRTRHRKVAIFDTEGPKVFRKSALPAEDVHPKYLHTPSRSMGKGLWVHDSPSTNYSSNGSSSRQENSFELP